MSEIKSPPEASLTDSRGRSISQEVADELQKTAARTQPFESARRVWDRLLSEEDRQQLGNNLEDCWRRIGTIGMWTETYEVSLETAVIEIGEGLDLISFQTGAWLRRELELDQPIQAARTNMPQWDSDRGELRLGNRVIRHIRVMKKPSNIQRIVEDFQADDWPVRIDNPLTHGQEELHQALRSLNDSLQLIRFGAREGARSINWRRV